MCFADWLHSHVDLSKVNMNTEVFERGDYWAVILQENSTVQLCLYDVAFTDPSILF